MYANASTFMCVRTVYMHTHRITFERVTQRGGKRQGTSRYFVRRICEGENSIGNVESRRGTRGSARRRRRELVGGNDEVRERRREKEVKG